MLAAWQTLISGNRSLFGLHDPTCEEAENYSEAMSGVKQAPVGWGTSALLVNVAWDRLDIKVHVEVHDARPALQPTKELMQHESQLIVPGGLLCIPESWEDQWQVGMPLPQGGGTYGVIVLGYGRKEVLQARSLWMTDPLNQPRPEDDFQGLEYYRIILWQISTEPRWPDSDDCD